MAIRYFKVQQETKPHTIFKCFWAQFPLWKEKEPDMEQLLGVSPVTDNLALEAHGLYMRKPPSHLLGQFTSRRNDSGFYRAKANSKIQKDWIKFCEEHGLYSMTANNLIFTTGLVMMGVEEIYPEMFGDFYLRINNERFTTENFPWLQEVDEPTFLRLMADWKEQKV